MPLDHYHRVRDPPANEGMAARRGIIRQSALRRGERTAARGAWEKLC